MLTRENVNHLKSDSLLDHTRAVRPVNASCQGHTICNPLSAMGEESLGHTICKSCSSAIGVALNGCQSCADEVCSRRIGCLPHAAVPAYSADEYAATGSQHQYFHPACQAS